jgi:hypothetical protein
MKLKTYIIIVLVAGLFGGPVSANPDEESSVSREYQIKAAFLYNFLKTVEWPEEVISDGNEPMVIGIIGKDHFGEAFDPIKGKSVKGRKVIVKRFEGLSQVDESSDDAEDESKALRKCHLLFVCSSEQKTFGEIIKSVKGHSVLTVSEVDNFLEAGGIINFIPSAEKGEFEINLAVAKRVRLKISSKLLRIAKRVIEEKPSEKAKN